MESTKILGGVGEDSWWSRRRSFVESTKTLSPRSPKRLSRITLAAQQTLAFQHDHEGSPAGSSTGLGRIAEGCQQDHLGGPAGSPRVQQEHRGGSAGSFREHSKINQGAQQDHLCRLSKTTQVCPGVSRWVQQDHHVG